MTGTQLTFGPGAVGSLSGVIRQRAAQRILIVSGPAILKAGLIDQVEFAIQQTTATSSVFADSDGEPSTDAVIKLVDAAKEFRPDLLVAIGGGGTMDLAKIGAACFASGMDAASMLGFNNVPESVTPTVCIPTTSGSGSEVSHMATLTNEESGKPAFVLSQRIRPLAAIVDPQLSMGCPDSITAASGMDALTHAIEAYLVNNFYTFHEDLTQGLPFEGNHPLGDLYAEKAIALIANNLHDALTDPTSLRARTGMAMGATLAGLAFSSCGLSLSHALEIAIGAKYKCHRGIGNAIVLPEVLRFWVAARTTRITKLATMLGVNDADIMPADEAVDAAISAITELRESIEMPSSLSEIGGAENDLSELAAEAINLQSFLALSPLNPSVDDMMTILSASL